MSRGAFAKGFTQDIFILGFDPRAISFQVMVPVLTYIRSCQDKTKRKEIQEVSDYLRPLNMLCFAWKPRPRKVEKKVGRVPFS